MKNFHFSLNKVHKYQGQKRRLAEMELARCKSELDQSIQQLKELNHHFDEVTQASHAGMNQGSQLTHAHRDLLEHLRTAIEFARQVVNQNMAKWQHTLAGVTAEKIRDESYEMLRRDERAAHTDAEQQAEGVTLSEIIMRQWAFSEGENSNG
ncbi:MAG: flagellar export protein FliJ [Pirellulaceae bacterium]